MRIKLGRFGVEWKLSFHSDKKQVAIFVSKFEHCIYDLLLRHRLGELDCDIALVISNHEKLRSVAEQFSVPFYVFPITKETKAEQEQKEIALLEEKKIETDGVFVEIGGMPNSEPVVDLVQLNDFKEIMIDCHCKTNVEGFFGAGDVTTVPYKQIVVSAGEGSKAALAAYDYLANSGKL